VARLWARQLGFDSWQEEEFYLFTTTSISTLGPTQPPVQWVPGRDSFPEVKVART